MAVIMFSPQFASQIKSGKKRRTIRIRQLAVGTPLSLREWSGVPYRKGSQKVSILETRCVASSVIQIYRTEKTNSIVIKVAMVALTASERRELAKSDGFNCVGDFVSWIEGSYGLPFFGWLTEW